MTELPTIRKRASKPKVRTGCIRCKTRRVKCDESKPHCFNCARLGTLCEYRSSVVPSQRNTPRMILPALGKQALTTSPRFETTIAYPLYTLPRSAFAHLQFEDVKYLDYFVRRFRGQLSLSRLGDSALSDFWSVTALQQGEQDSYVLHAVLAIAALAWARSSIHSRVPLFQLSGALRNEHYCKALQHYVKAVAETKQVLNNASPDRQLLVSVMSCLLFSMFEHLQDNVRAVNQIGAIGFDAMPKLVSATTPDALTSGTKASHFILNSSVISNAFSPMNSQLRPRILNIAAESSLQPPAVPSPERSLQEFTAVWWRLVTNMLNLCFHSAAFGDGFVVPSYSPSQTHSLVTLIGSWEREAQRRILAAQDPHSIQVLHIIAAMARRLHRSVEERRPAHNRTSGVDGVHTFFSTTPLSYSALLELYRASKMQQRGAVSTVPMVDKFDFLHNAAQDAALPALLYVARWCPNNTTRLEALDICYSLLRPASSFNLKAIYMVMRVLVNIEGESEKLANRYTWTEGSWNADYTALHVTLTRADQKDGKGVRGILRLVLSVQDYGM